MRSRLLFTLAVIGVLSPIAASASIVWYGDKDGLHQIDAAANRVVVNVPFEPPVALAVNAADNSVWALTQKRLTLVSGDGNVQRQIALRDLGSGLGAPRFVAVNPNDGSVWAGFENRLLHFDAAGALQNAVAIAAADIAVAQDGSLWTLTQSSLEQRDLSATLVKSVTLSGPAKGAKHLALDDAGGGVWLAGDKDVVKVSLASPDQTLFTMTAAETISSISLDPQSGDLWLLGQNSLFALNRDGSPTLTRDLRTFSISNSQSLVFDFGSAALWVGHQQGLSRITTDGTFNRTFPADAKAVAIAIGRAPLNITPVVTIVAPAGGSVVSAQGRPEFRVKYDALCGGTSCGFPNAFFKSFALSATINGTDYGSSFVFDAATGGATFTPPSRLPEGANGWSVQATAFGKSSASVSATFTIDTTAPKFGGVTPPSGTHFQTSAVTITGSVDDPLGTVTLNSQTQGSAFAFTVVLNPGINNLTLLAADSVGNVSALPLTYVFNLPPSVHMTAPPDQQNFSAPASFAVTADATDLDGVVTSVEFFNNGSSLGTDASAPYAASVSNLPEGTYTLTAKATDNFGDSSVSAPITVFVGPPNALPSVQWKSPAAGTKFSAPATIHVVATAADSDGTIAKVEFFRNGTIAATATSAPFEATLTDVPAGTQSLTAKATDDRGGSTTTAPQSVTVNAALLTVSKPHNNDSVRTTSVGVAGFITALPNSGVMVNDIPAPVDALGNFALNVPLDPGANTLTVRLTTPDGTVVTQTLSVTSTADAPPYAIAASPPVGWAPLPVTFTILNQTTAAVSCTWTNFNFPFSIPAGSSIQLTVTFNAGVTDNAFVFADGTKLDVVVEARDRAQMDQMFRSMWSGLNAALVAGDKDGAMRYLSDGGRRKFGPVFDVLMPFMSQIVASYSPFAQSQLNLRYAEYAVSRMDNGQKKLYLIYFVLGTDGIWRIDEM